MKKLYYYIGIKVLENKLVYLASKSLNVAGDFNICENSATLNKKTRDKDRAKVMVYKRELYGTK